MSLENLDIGAMTLAEIEQLLPQVNEIVHSLEAKAQQLRREEYYRPLLAIAAPLLEKLPPGFELIKNEVRWTKEQTQHPKTQACFTLCNDSTFMCHIGTQLHVMCASAEGALQWFENLKLKRYEYSLSFVSGQESYVEELLKGVIPKEITRLSYDHKVTVTSEEIPNE